MTRAAIFALGCCAFFCVAGVMFAPLLGIEDDESLFGTVVWAPAPANSIQVAALVPPLSASASRRPPVRPHMAPTRVRPAIARGG